MITREIRSGERFVDRYRIIRRLGTGGMATVWLAEDERLGREVAVKRLKTDAPEESLKRFRREARLGATLNHPNFVSVFDTIATDDCALIVMEYVPGHSVEELEARGPMEPARVVSILEGAAAALDHAHAQGVVHRDIKPANILVREDGTVKLADLGIARAMDATQITTEGKVIGTLPYMAPERMEAAGAGGPSSDVYALAAVAYELLSGSPLDGGPTGPQHRLERQELAARWPDAPAGAFAVVMRGLSEDPARRQGSAGKFVEELDDALRRGEQQTRPFEPPSPETRPRPLFSRSPDLARSGGGRTRGALALALILIAGIAVAGIALLGGGSGGDGAGKKEAKRTKAVKGNGGSGGAGSSRSQPATSEPSAAAPVEEATPAVSSGDGVTLNAQGFELINQGRYAEAVPILRQAVASFPEGSTDLNYAYALYNLGNALRLSGHPEEAIPILERRLEIPNQQSTVAAELARARADAGTG